MKLHELDTWFKENGEGSELDDALRLRGITWDSLGYEKKLSLYTAANPVRQPGAPAESKRHDDSAARRYHAQPETIAYFRENKLNHESGDYREQA